MTTPKGSYQSAHSGQHVHSAAATDAAAMPRRVEISADFINRVMALEDAIRELRERDSKRSRDLNLAGRHLVVLETKLAKLAGAT